MAHPRSKWLLEPTFPAVPALPRLERELYELAQLEETMHEKDVPAAQYPSGTWRVGTHPERAEAPGFAKSDSEAPTVRPGSLYARKAR